MPRLNGMDWAARARDDERGGPAALKPGFLAQLQNLQRLKGAPGVTPVTGNLTHSAVRLLSEDLRRTRPAWGGDPVSSCVATGGVR